MQKKRMNKKENWALAQKQAKQMGIVLTKRKNSKGEYVCYLDKKSNDFEMRVCQQLKTIINN